MLPTRLGCLEFCLQQAPGKRRQMAQDEFLKSDLNFQTTLPKRGSKNMKLFLDRLP
jgi:hypothetical protein